MAFMAPPSDSVRFLEMCTEILGCENGAMCYAYDVEVGAATKTSHLLSAKKNGRKQRSSATSPEFPPPLTTLHGEGRLRLHRKREDGRLLLLPFKPSLLIAERSGGRLLLRYLPGGLPARRTEEVLEAEEEEKESSSPAADEDGAIFVHGSGRKYRRAGRCVEDKKGGSGKNKMTAAAAIFNPDAFWVTSS